MTGLGRHLCAWACAGLRGPLALALALTLLAPPTARADDAGAWTAQLTPYAWGAGIDGTLTPFAGAPTVRIDKSFGDVLEDLDAAFFLSGYARRDRLVLLGDVSYSASSAQGQVPPGLPAEGRLRQTSLTLAAGWRAVEGERLRLDLLAGLRHWNLAAAAEIPLAGLARSPDREFTDPLLAVRGNLTLAPRWSLIAYADYGGFGVGSEDTHQVLATVNYAGSARLVVSAGLRRLSVDYRSGGTRVDLAMTGPLLGATWRF